MSQPLPWTGRRESGTGQQGVVLVADSSIDGAALAALVEDAGLTLLSSDAVALPERVARLAPLAIVVDLESAHAPDAVRRIRKHVDPEAAPPLILPTVPETRLRELGFVLRPIERVFPRPVVLERLASFLRQLATGVAHGSGSGASRHSQPRDREVSSRPSSSSMTDAASVPEGSDPLLSLPDLGDELEGAGSSRDAVPSTTALSPEIAALLEKSARRARDESTPPAKGPARSNAIAPEALMRQLEELLDDGDDAASAAPEERAAPASESARDLGTKEAPRARAPRVTSIADGPPPSMPPVHTAVDLVRYAAPIAPPQQTLPPQQALPPSRPPPAERAPQVTPPPARAPVLATPAAQSPQENGSGVEVVARAVAQRKTGALHVSSAADSTARTIVLRDGDLVTAATETDTESLVQVLVERGELNAELARSRAGRLPRSGRHAAAALIAQGFLAQDELWPVLRAHAEWLIGRVLGERDATASLSSDIPDRLSAEPSVFGGAAGVEILVDLVRRTVDPAEALQRLGGAETRLEDGPNATLLHEAALDPRDLDAVAAARSVPLRQAMRESPERATLFYALVALEVLKTDARQESAPPSAREADPLDADAVRKRVQARLDLVHEGDYFALLGVTCDATAYAIRQAYVELRRRFEPARLLDAGTADLDPDVRLIAEVLDEAYEVLRDANRRTRYRRALLAAREPND